MPMFRQFKLATVIALVLSAVGVMGSADAHVGRGGLGGGARLGGGPLVQRARAGNNGNANGNRNGGIAGNPAPVPVPAPAPKATVPAPKPAAPPIVQIGGANSPAKPPVTSSNAAPTKPTTGAVVANSAPKTPITQTPAPTTPPGKANDSHLVFNLTGNVVTPEVENTNDVPAEQPKGLSPEAKKALADLAADAAAAAAENPLPAVVKEATLPQIPVGATITLNGKDLSDKEGQVVLQIGEIALPATITEWKNNAVTCTLPVLGLAKSSKATLHVLKADGKTASMLNCELVIATTAEAKP